MRGDCVRKRLVARIALLFALLVALVGCSSTSAQGTQTSAGSQSAVERGEDASATGQQDAAEDPAFPSVQSGDAAIDEAGTYTSKDEVALYLHTYGHLPSNYITKEEAEDAGWKTEGLTIDEACPGKSLGNNHYGNDEKKLPTAKGRTWQECDIDYNGGRSRGAKRLVYSNDGLIFYTEDHYETFEQLY